MLQWFKQGSEIVRIKTLEERLDALEAKITKYQREILDATETLDRVTKRSFRLKEQLLRLEQTETPTQEKQGLSRHDLLRMGQR